MKIAFDEEVTLRQEILPELEKGRPDWDRPHTETVVYWMKKMLEHVKLDPKVMITAAYAHDWGYIGLFPDRTTYGSVMAAKKQHMVEGGKKIKKLLESKLKKGYSKKQIERIVHLVKVHDNLAAVADDDEILLVEADTLGALDASRVKPTFKKEDNLKYLEEVMKLRRPLFRHKIAEKYFARLVKKREGYYEKQA